MYVCVCWYLTGGVSRVLMKIITVESQGRSDTCRPPLTSTRAPDAHLPLRMHLNLSLPLSELITCTATKWAPAKFSEKGEKKTITANICKEVAMELF